MMDSRARLKALFSDLFQLDVADLDFGLYRLFRLKRAEVEAFLEKQLPEEVDRAFEAAAGAERAVLRSRVDDLADRARASVADDAILPSGEPNPAHAAAKAVKEYAEAHRRLQAIEVSEVQRAEVFNLLYAFFSRYYDDGDFIPRRFFGSRPVYAVAYSGEELFFHWANKNQHYVKTGEAFRDYAFTVSTVSGDYRLRFKLAEATAPKDDAKGDARFFFPLPQATTLDDVTRTFTLPFHYRLPTAAEVEKYGKNAKGQETILLEAESKIFKAVKDPLLLAALTAASPTDSAPAAEPPPTLLRRRLLHFARKNTTDYFVHKDLRVFLRQELEFFLRDQVVHEADLEGDFEAKRRLIRVFRILAVAVIEFLVQIEEAARRLFEKRKFVLQTDYLLPIHRVPRALWPEVLANSAQLTEWRELFSLAESGLLAFKGQVSERVLEQHRTLVVDTRHFSAAFTAQLLEATPDLDEHTDGVVFNSESFQALSLMYGRYREQVTCVYIDPPYNSKTTQIMYKNTYKHSSWIALMDGRLGLSKLLATADGSHVVAIDENEQEVLGRLLALQFPNHERVCIAVIHNKKGIQGAYFSYNHDYAYFCIPPALTETHGTVIPEEQWEFDNLRKWGRESERHTARHCFYPIFVKGNRIAGFGDICRDDFHPGAANIRQRDQVAIYPVDSQGVERKWRYSRQSVEGISPLLRVHVVKGSGEVQIHKAKAEKAIKTVWDDPKYIAGDYGTKWLTDLGLKISQNLYPKSVHTVEDSIFAVSNPDSLILDYFAGTGTTGHAVINLNRRDGGRRKFILVDMAEYFDTVLVSRLKKVMFTPVWKNGKPTRLPTKEEADRTPRLVKVLRLESYEDALHNTFSDDAVGRLTEREKAHQDAIGDEEYRIRYLVQLPLEASHSMLSLARLEHPFDYTLEVLTDYGPKTKTVDLVETFNWLYGLRAQRVLTRVNPGDTLGKDRNGRSYRVVVASDRDANTRILVVWRDMTGLDPTVERPFLEAQAKALGPFDEQWINGDTSAQGFASLNGLFKRLMEDGSR